MVQLWGTLKAESIIVTDRSFINSKKIVQAEAWLRGHAAVQMEDLEILRHCFWSDERHEKKVFNLILELVSPEKGKIMEEYEKVKGLATEISRCISDKRKTTELATEFSVKSKQAMKTMETQKKLMQQKNLDLSEVNDLITKTVGLRREILLEHLGADLT
jgi:CO dehydrogenase/acetyl-CoA synthase alpha subunit